MPNFIWPGVLDMYYNKYFTTFYIGTTDIEYMYYIIDQ